MKRIGLAFILFLLASFVEAQTYVYSLPNTATTEQWVKLGTFNANQQGFHLSLMIVSSYGYNAMIGQDQVSYIHFKSSNASSVNATGFAGDSWWYQTGPNVYAPSQVVWVANMPGTSATQFSLYANFAQFTGSDSYYVVNVPPGATWTNSAIGEQANPGANSANVLVAENEFYVGSVATFARNVGIGTTSPSAKLEVSGGIKLSANSGGAITFQDGTVQSTAYTGVVCGGDYAESVDVTGDRTKYEPGDVLVLDSDVAGKFLRANRPYSTLVAGIYSTKPGTVGRRQTTPKSEDEIPMAVVGIVPTKVSTENGAIRIGDLLVTSSTLGYAMKGTDHSQMLGAVIGKAMGALDSGTGVVEVLVSLQ